MDRPGPFSAFPVLLWPLAVIALICFLAWIGSHHG